MLQCYGAPVKSVNSRALLSPAMRILFSDPTSESRPCHFFCFILYSNININYLIRPDIPGQSNMDPNTAAQLWMANGQPLRAQGYQTITPAVAFSKDWMHKFLAACNNCDVRANPRFVSLPVHSFFLTILFFSSLIIWLRTFTLLHRRR